MTVNPNFNQTLPTLTFKDTYAEPWNLKPKMIAYLNTYCPGEKTISVSRWLVMYQNLMQHFENNTEHTIPSKERHDYYVAFTWGLMSIAIEKDAGFDQGMIKFEDPGHRIVEFFRPQSYRRPSSHYKERVMIKGRFSWLLNAYAIDDTRFPAGHRTSIFGPVKTLCGKDYSFLKIENHSAAPWKPLDFIWHTFDYLLSRARVWELPFFRDPKEKDYREEDIPNEIVLKYKNLVQRTPVEHKPTVEKTLTEAKEYGIASIWKSSIELLNFASEMIKKQEEGAIKNEWCYIHTQADDLRNELEAKYADDVHIRKGNEVVVQGILKKKARVGLS